MIVIIYPLFSHRKEIIHPIMIKCLFHCFLSTICHSHGEPKKGCSHINLHRRGTLPQEVVATIIGRYLQQSFNTCTDIQQQLIELCTLFGRKDTKIIWNGHMIWKKFSNYITFDKGKKNIIRNGHKMSKIANIKQQRSRNRWKHTKKKTKLAYHVANLATTLTIKSYSFDGKREIDFYIYPSRPSGERGIFPTALKSMIFSLLSVSLTKASRKY